MERYRFNNFTVAKCENCNVVKLQESKAAGSKNWNNAQLENILCSCNLKSDEVSVCCSNIRTQSQTASLAMLVSFSNSCSEWKHSITEETGRDVLRPKSLLNLFKINVILQWFVVLFLSLFCCALFCFGQDSTNKWYHRVFIFFCLVYFNDHNTLQFYPCCNSWKNLLLL